MHTLIEQARRLLMPRVLILMYHRVGDPGVDPWKLCVTPEHFAEQLAVLRGTATFQRLQEGIDVARHGYRRDYSIVLTFDDGYADNLYAAKPLLEDYEAPATVFVASGQIGSPREFWWDELASLILQPDALPQTLTLETANEEYRWELGEAARPQPAHIYRDRMPDVWSAAPGSRLGFYHEVWQRLFPLTVEARATALDSIAEWVGGRSTSCAARRALTQSEVRMLAAGGLVEIGGHTVTHVPLALHEPKVQEYEIQRCRETLTQITGTAPRSFSYPHGEYSPLTVNLVRQAGFTCGCTVRYGRVDRRSSPYQLPRVEVQDWDGCEFGARLERWLTDKNLSSW